MKRRIALLGISICLVSLYSAIAAEPPSPPSPAEGSAVEVREGDSWSAATFLRKEGRRLLIRYNDNKVEEWISPDRLRLPTAASARGSATRSSSPNTSSGGQSPAAAPLVTLDTPCVEIAAQDPPISKHVSPMIAKTTPTTRPSDPFVRITMAGAPALPLISKFLTCADTPDILIGVSDIQDRKTFQLVRIDLQHPDKTEVRILMAPGQDVQSAASGGQLILTKASDSSAKALHVWEYAADQYNLRANYMLVSKKGGRNIDWARFTTPTRIAALTGNADIYLADLETCKSLATIECRGSGTSLHPSGHLLQITDSTAGYLLRGSDLAIIAQLPAIPWNHGLSVDPTGTFAAFPDKVNVKVLRIGTGTVSSTIYGAWHRGDTLHLISAENILIGEVLYDIKTGVPVWRYALAPKTIVQLLPSGQVLYAMPDKGGSAACMVTLPDPKALEAFKARRPDDYLLAPGAKISVANLDVYQDHARTAQDLIQAALTTAGHELTTGASAYVMSFTSAAGPTEEKLYAQSFFGGPFAQGPARKVNVPSTIVTATLTKDGEAIWQQTWKYVAGDMLTRHRDQSLENAVIAASRPDASSLTSMAIPAYIPKGSTPGEPAALGASTITPQGFGPPPEKKIEPPAPAAPPVPDRNRPGRGTRAKTT